MIAPEAAKCNYRQDTATSAFSMPGMVGIYFGCRICITFLFFRADPQAGTIVALALNLSLLVPLFFYAYGPASITLKQALRVLPFRLTLAFLALALTSLLWSETQTPVVGLAYWVALASDVALVLLVFHAEPGARASECLMKGYICGVCVLALVAWTAPAMKDLRLGDQDYLNPNAIGFECAFGAFFCQYLAPQGARWKWLGAALAITLVRSLSKTSIIAFVIAEMFYLYETKTISRSSKILLASTSAVVLAIFSGLFAAYYTIYTNAGDQAETLTGRTAIWLVTYGFAVQEPWFGHGFHSFRTVIPIFDNFEPWHAHNEILNQFFLYGITGVALLVTLYGSLFVQIRRRLSEPLPLLTGSLLLMVIIRGVADTERFDLSFPLWSIATLSLTIGQIRVPQKQEVFQ
jgi:O-antigen ligase